ncbi:arginase [Rickettsiales bacterium LUAb2]
MDKKSYQIYGIATGICAEKYGSQLGVWDIYYSLRVLSLVMEEIFYIDSNKSKLEAIDDIVPLYKNINQKVLKNYTKNDKYLFYTGDHSNGIAVWSSISNAINKDIGLIWVDAHLDCHTPSTSDSKNVHGMPIAHLMGYGDKRLSSIINNKLKPENICYIATRDYEQAELEFVQKHNIKVFFMKDITKENVNDIFNQAIEHITKNTKYFGISLDMDSMSPEFIPGTGCFNPDGLNPKDVILNIQKASKNEKFIGLEITEYNPLLDIDRKTFNFILELTKAII